MQVPGPRCLGGVSLVVENLHEHHCGSRVDDDDRHGKIKAVFAEHGPAQVKYAVHVAARERGDGSKPDQTATVPRWVDIAAWPALAGFEVREANNELARYPL